MAATAHLAEVAQLEQNDKNSFISTAGRPFMTDGDVPSESIADASKPNAGRVYDYLLGGDHNFEVDRKAGEELRKLSPNIPKRFRLIRWFLVESVSRLAGGAISHFLDFASGLPTQDHIHNVVPSGVKVIYSDIDEITVNYGKELIEDIPGVRYVRCDAAQPETLLNSGIVGELFGNIRKVAIGYNGILWFLSDDAFSHAMRTLYDWAATGSIVYLTTDDTPESVRSNPRYQRLSEYYRTMNQPFFPKTLAKVQELAKPRKLTEEGFKYVEQWIQMESHVSEEMVSEWQGMGLYGGFLVKE
jgi:hypothetical protein